jgi:hypothetical protein
MAGRRRPNAGLSWERRVINDQDGLGPADEPVGLGQEFGFERGLVPRADRHEVMQLIVVGRSHPSGHRLQALALTGSNQPGPIKRAHAPARRMTEVREERFKPGLEFALPGQ